MATKEQKQEDKSFFGLGKRKWILIPVVFVFWTVNVIILLYSLSDTFPELKKLHFGMGLDTVKEIISGMEARTQTQYPQVIFLLSFLFL